MALKKRSPFDGKVLKFVYNKVMAHQQNLFQYCHLAKQLEKTMLFIQILEMFALAGSLEGLDSQLSSSVRKALLT